MDAQIGSNGARKLRWRKAMIAAASLVFSLGAVELLLRSGLVGERYSTWKTGLAMEDIAGAINRRFGTPDDANVGVGQDMAGMTYLLHPYFGAEQSNSPARYQEEAERLKKTHTKDTYDVMVVGGSVAGIFTLHGGARFIELVQADPRFAGRTVRVTNQARGGYKQPQQLNLVTYLLNFGYAPDAIINIDGFNECALGNTNAVLKAHPIYPSVSHWSFLVSGSAPQRDALDHLAEMRQKQLDVERCLERVTSLNLHYSAIVGKLVLSRMKRMQHEYSVAYDKFTSTAPTRSAERVLSGPPFHQGSHATLLDAAVSEVERIWEESSVSLSGVCAARSIYYLHVLQPTLHDPGSKPLDEAEIKSGTATTPWIEGVQSGYPLLRAAAAQLRARGVNFVDLSMLFRDISEPLYYDACHFNVAGNQLLAEALAKAFLESFPSR